MGIWNDHICTFCPSLPWWKYLTAVTKELVSRQRPFAGRSEIQVFHAVTRGEVPSFSSQSENETSTIRNMLEEICCRCWTNDPALRPTMNDIVRDLRPETWFLQEDQNPKYISEISDLGREL